MRVLRAGWIGIQIIFAVLVLLVFIAFCPHARR